MKKFLFMAAMMFAGINQSHAAERLSVVELFTSQGCSSCPPADEYLGELAERDDVLALAYHVDYWDYIGWKDQFASAAFTQRQRTYARQFNLRYVYTPQMIVSGRYENSGNRQDVIRRAISADQREAFLIDLQHQGNTITLTGPQQDEELLVYHVQYYREVETDVKRGENRGRKLTEFNIVKSLTPLGLWQGQTSKFEVAKETRDRNIGDAIFVQRPNDLQILTAFKL